MLGIRTIAAASDGRAFGSDSVGFGGVWDAIAEASREGTSDIDVLRGVLVVRSPPGWSAPRAPMRERGTRRMFNV
jgi:hypothetical protein